jgi:hypothetical protein
MAENAAGQSVILLLISKSTRIIPPGANNGIGNNSVAAHRRMPDLICLNQPGKLHTCPAHYSHDAQG